MSPEASANPGDQSGDAGGIESSPSPIPTAQVAKSYAVLVYLFAGRGTYTIALVGSDAQVVAHAQAARRSDIADSIEFAVDAPRHVNIGHIEILPTFQVPGGLTFDRR